MRRFLGRVQPRIGVIMETELWPSLTRECARRGVSLFLVNARMSARSAAGYRRLAALTSATLRCFRAVAAQTQADAERLQALGAERVAVTGNLKFEVDPPARQLELGRQFRAWIGARPVWLAASTRAGEEKLILDAFMEGVPVNVLLVLVPRHPQRFNEAASLARARDLTLQRRSDNVPVRPSTRVWLGDSLGEMFAYYAAADSALVGGSLLPHGGQNLIEACAVGCPVLVGPHTENFRQATEDAIRQGAAIRVADAAEWVGQARHLSEDAVSRRAMGESAKAFAAAHKGAAARVCELVCGV
jgi:3-deoxy-D-manno-octulosonic-acid transferase